ncbi:MAG: helix-turn-helix transcriptional regulator [Nocardioides sp.]|nr:helix-turn-helix transcriptional regulator [Nocardioides sp.]
MPDVAVRTCSVARTLDVIGERWSLIVIRELMLGTTRFADIARYTGAPRDILTTRLRRLEEHGLVRRELYQSRPDRYGYHLTELGQSLVGVVTALREWGDEHLAGDDGPPNVFDHGCGEVLHAKVVCAACGEEVEHGDIRRHRAAEG